MDDCVDVAILTKSAKNGGYCVAGIDMDTRQWIRLVSSDANSCGALFSQDLQYKDGTYCEPFDIARIPILGKHPHVYQPENVLINEETYWKKIGVISVPDLIRLHPPEKHNNLLGNIYPYITAERIGDVGISLILVKVGNLIITHPTDRSTKAEFSYGFARYENMSVTDPEFYHIPSGTKISQALLVMSLPDSPYNERKYYKFIAKIIKIK